MKPSCTVIFLVLLCFFASVLLQGQDRRSLPDSDDNSVVVPVGTNITVEFKYNQEEPSRASDAKVVWPVRIGFSTVVPVGTPVKVQVATRYYDTGAVVVARLTSVDNRWNVLSDANR